VKSTVVCFVRKWVLGLALFLAASVSALSQQNAPHIGFLYPAGGRQGDSFEVRVGGQFLDNIAGAYVTGENVQAKVLELQKPLSGKEIAELRDRIQELQKKGKEPAILKEINEIRLTIADNLNRAANPAISQRAHLQITVAPDAAPGKRELRLKTPLGMSNPLVFCIGRLPEVRENFPKTGADDAVTKFSLPAVLNGQLIPGSVGDFRMQIRQQQSYLPGDVDRFRFAAHKGQHLVATVSARELIPYLADAVPGWIQAVIALYDSSGIELAYKDDSYFNPDPVLYYEIPADGDYTIEIRDALYRGRDDFVYRVTIGEISFLTSIFPLGGRAGKRIKVETAGWNLPERGAAIDARDKSGIYPFWVGAGALQSNSKPFMVGDQPGRLEAEPNDSVKQAQRIKLPIIVDGRINRPGDVDVFRFKGRAGDQIVAEVYARRLESPLDSIIKLFDEKGRRLAFNDDCEDKGFGLETHHADSYLTGTLPAKGDYYVSLEGAQNEGGPEYGYRLRIGAPQPDFDLRVTPSSVSAIVGPVAPMAVYALRKDGFSGEIQLSLKNAPKGFILHGGLIPAGQDKLPITLTIPPEAGKEPVKIILEGKANIQGREVVRLAVAAEDMMQAFAYRHLVPAEELWANSAGRGLKQAGLRILSDQPVKIPSGGSIRFRIAMPAFASLERVRFELIDPPEGISIAESSLAGQNAEFVLRSDAAKTKQGVKGNLIVSVSGERRPAAKDKPNAATQQRSPLGTLPAIPFEIARLARTGS
jgi:hypothetical protein